LGPVTFQIGAKKIQPYAVAPWTEEKTDAALPPMLKVLRGDFFCLPFGGNETPFRGERHPPHGETANARWRCDFAGQGRLHLSMVTKTRPGRVDKFISLHAGHAAVYQRHIISGMRGPMAFGHHPMLKFPDSPDSGLVATSRFVWGAAAPTPLENPGQRGYSRLQPGAAFRSLAKVRTCDGGWTDLSTYPARRGYEDLVQLVSDVRQPFAWTAVTFPAEGYVWFSIKDPRVLRQTIFWFSNGGRHYPPWSGRHVNVMGLEEVTSYFHYGLPESAKKNPLITKGYVTCHQLDPKKPLVVNYIMAVAPIPKGFDHVAAITPAADHQSVRLTSRSGRTVVAPLDLDFIGLAD
ncbi:MAG: hypothetical protein WC485_04535, partial [Opitutaceae bacterium]